MFGGGYGEAICVHTCDHEWVTVDSCLNPQSGQPAALTYLEAIGLAPRDAVRLVVVTHWHDDHIRGIGRLVEVCTEAVVACSAALRREDIVQFVLLQHAAAGAIGSGVDELRTVLELCRTRKGRMLWAKANLPLHPQPPGDAPKVFAISPSEDAVERSVEDLITIATKQPMAVARRFQAPEKPNGTSVATSIRKAGLALLLGADLEVSDNSEAGWNSVLRYARPPIKASLVKVPHHGSPTAHHDGFWTELAEDQVVAIVTPWAREPTSCLPT